MTIVCLLIKKQNLRAKTHRFT